MANKLKLKKKSILRRKRSIKNKITIGKYPRLVVFRSNIHLYAQLIDDLAQTTICSASTLDKDLRPSLSKGGSTCDASIAVGELVAKRALEKGIQQVVFDRGGNIYHGRVKALANAAREAGLQF